MLLALSVAALFAVATDSTRIQHAATIHSDSADYLQLDFAPLPGCGRPVVDSLVLQGRAKVVWHMDTTLDSGCAATTRANLLVAFPSNVGGTHGAVDIDTVYDARRDSSLFPVPKVHYPKVTACLYDCYAPLDSATAFQTVAAKVAGASYVAFLSPYEEESYVAVFHRARTARPAWWFPCPATQEIGSRGATPVFAPTPSLPQSTPVRQDRYALRSAPAWPRVISSTSTSCRLTRSTRASSTADPIPS